MNAFSAHAFRAAIVTALLGVSATAAASPPTPFGGMSELAPEYMAQLTGGLAVGGLKIDLTARVRTYINDRLAVAEDYRITRLNDGQQRVQARLSSVDQRVTEGASRNAPTTHSASDTRIERTALSDGGLRSRTVDKGDGGVTSMTFDFGRDQLVSTIANTANDRNIHQRVNVDVKIANFSEFTSNIRSSLMAERIGRAVNGQ